MNKFYSLIFFISLSISSHSQNNGFKYQAILRDATGNVNANTTAQMDISILQGSADGTSVFTETHAITSNTFGLVNLTIGSQNPTDFDLIDWANGPYFIKIIIDGVEFGTSQLLSVPYALHASSSQKATLAETAENFAETDPLFTSSTASTITQTQIHNWTNKLSEYAETDPSFNASVASKITTEQIESWTNKLDSFLEADPEFAASLAKGITASDTAYWNSKLDEFVETDPIFLAHPSAGITANDITMWKALWIWYTTNANGYLTSESDPVFNASVAKGIAATDTTNWNTTNYSELTNAPDLANSTNQKQIRLNTNDMNSSFEITKNNGSSVFKANGAGQLSGDGSGLKNVKSLINYVGGDQRFQITANYGSFNNVRQVTLSVPANGVCFVMASGYVDWESTGWDLYLGGILMDQDPNSSWSAENEWYNYLNIITDYNCADSSDQYTSFAQHRSIPVTAGTHTFYLWVNKYSSASLTEVGDVNMTVIYIPTGGSGAAPQMAALPNQAAFNEKRSGTTTH